MKLGFVVPRYGIEVVGGAELGARMLAEHLVSQLGWQVEVFTTCALEHTTWANHFPPASLEINGVTVNRFKSVATRAVGFEDFSSRLLANPSAATMDDALKWIELQGPVCPDAIESAELSDCDLIAFYPYLYHPTVEGVRRLAGRAVMHPAAHDEPPIRLPVFQEVFQQSQGLVFQTYGERRFVLDLFRVAHKPQVVVGLGVDRCEPDERGAAEVLGTGVLGSPYIVCLGRVDAQKGSRQLEEMFVRYKREHPGDLKLVFAGPVVDRPADHPDIVVTGIVTEGAKWAILGGAVGLVSPSPHEAFSLVVVEGWLAGLPVLVNGACEATREHCERSGGGFYFGGPLPRRGSGRRAGSAELKRVGPAIGGRDTYEDFADTMDFIVDPKNKGEVEEMVSLGQGYVERNFSWDSVVGRYSAFLNGLAHRIS